MFWNGYLFRQLGPRMWDIYRWFEVANQVSTIANMDGAVYKGWRSSFQGRLEMWDPPKSKSCPPLKLPGIDAFSPTLRQTISQWGCQARGWPEDPKMSHA